LGAFGRTGGAGSDFHALWPSDIKGNQQAHSNYNFATPTSSINNVNNDVGTYVGRNGYISGSSQKVFEPLDEYKGDIARAMFYMPARYYEYIDELHPKLELVNGSPDAVTASESQSGLAGDLATLLEWNLLDPVDEHEIRRNNLLYNNYQGNRNPFIDHPEWAHIAYDVDYVGPGATTASGTSSVGDNPAWQNTSSPLVNITVNTSNAKTNYWLNDPLNTSGLIVTAYYEDSSSKTVFSYTTNPEDETTLNTPGTNTITVSYTENEITKTTTYDVTVGTESRTLLNISLDTSSVQTTFSLFDLFSSDNLVVTANYDVSDPEEVDKYMIDTPNMGKIGTQDVEVTYQSQKSSYTITITNQGTEFLRDDPSEGLTYESPNATSGSISGWTGFGLGSAYADGSVKLDSSGDYIYKTDIWSGEEANNIVALNVVARLKLNYSTGNTETNKMTVYALN
jgi:hypothetical protein